MTEIKFRARDKEEQKFYEYGQLALLLDLSMGMGLYGDDDGGKSGLWEHEYYNNKDCQRRFELFEYTGLKDKNNKEIYYDCDKVRFLFFYAGGWIELIGKFTFNDYELKAEIDIDNHPQGFVCLTYNPQTMKDFEIIK